MSEPVKQSDAKKPKAVSPATSSSDMPEVRVLLSLRGHEMRTRQRLAFCDELVTMLETLYRSAHALASSGLGSAQTDLDTRVSKAPASMHTICSMVRDLGSAINRTLDLVDFDGDFDAETEPSSARSPVMPVVQQTLAKAIDEHTGLRNWSDTERIGLSFGARRRMELVWSVAMECFRTNPKSAYPAMRPVVLLARRIAKDTLELLDPATGPIAEDRGHAYSITKKIRAQVEHIRNLMVQKCDTMMGEMQAVQSAIVKAQSQTMSLVRNLSDLGAKTP